MSRKLVLWISVLLVLVVAGYVVFLRGDGRKYDFRFEKITAGDLTVFVTATGTINPVTSVDVGTQVSGIISKLYADFNSVVKKGNIIAQIDSTFLVQSVKDAEASLEKAKAQYADSKRNYEREKALLEKGLDSQLNYDASLTTNESNAAALKSAEAALDRARINLAYATIYAPISGVVINRAVNVGQTVAASFSSPTLYTIANDLRKMQVLTTVDESDIGRISIGQEATFTVDAYTDETFKGIVSQIRLAPVSIQNVVNYTVVIDVNNDQLKLMPGMTANVKVLVASVRDVLRVPNMALRFQPPADIIDSTKLNAMPGAFAMRGGADADPADPGGMAGGRGQRHPAADSSAQGRSPGGKRGPQGATGAAARSQSPGVTARQKTTNEEGQFGITARFPEYEKSSYVPVHQAARARLWILNAAGRLEPVFVRTGVSDGRFTEVTGENLKAGDQIVLGITYNSDVAAEQTRSPLTGGQQGPGRGGFR